MSTVAHIERTLAKCTAFFRITGLGQCIIALVLTKNQFSQLSASIALLSTVIFESLLVVLVCIHRGALQPHLISVDVIFLCLGLIVGAVLTVPHAKQSWAYFMYPFTIITSVGLGMAYQRLIVALGFSLLLAVSYALSAIELNQEPSWNAIPNGISYLANTAVAWAVARQLRHNGDEADATRLQAVARADELAVERERGRHARMLHDRVLQTLEALARGDQIPDANLRAQIGTEAAWLRALVEGVPMEQSGDLLAALQRTIQRHIRGGLNIEFNSAQLRDAEQIRKNISPIVVEAIVDATSEALFNVAKHSGGTTAIVRSAVCLNKLTLSILDRGCGFNPAAVRMGIGLSHSITGRMTAVGGYAHIDSAPGAGTYIELVFQL